MKLLALCVALVPVVVSVAAPLDPPRRNASVVESGDRQTLPTRTDARLALGKIPIHFVPNRGQADSSVRFLGHGLGATLLLTDDAALVLDATSRIVLRQSIVGGSRSSRVEGSAPLNGKSHFFLGRAQDQWQTDVPQFSRVSYRDVYPGIDLVYYGNAGALEYDWIVAPGADPRSIMLAMEGPERARLDKAGHLLLDTAAGTMRLARPVAYQSVGAARRGVDADYVLDRGNRVRYAIGAHDPSLPLVIDPNLQYSTYLGGDGPDFGFDVALDSQGSVYVTGETKSPNFPLKDQIATAGGDYDVFVAKLGPALNTLIYSTYLGGVGADRGYGIAVDPQGNAYVTGFTKSPNFPVTSGAFDTTCGTDGACNPVTSGGRTFQHDDAFIVKLDPAGKLAYGTYLGGTMLDWGTGIAVDVLGTAYVTGSTQSRNFPTTPGAFQTKCFGVNPNDNTCTQDAYVTRINGAGSDLVYSTFLGGTSIDEGRAIALDVNTGIASAAYITGVTQSVRDFPTTAGAFQRTAVDPLGPEAFVTKLDALGRKLVYSSYLGGSSWDYGYGITVDRDGSAYVIGHTNSPDFPTVGAFDATCGTDGTCNYTGLFGVHDVFVSKFNPQGSGLVYSTYLGGGDGDWAGGIVVDGSFNAYVTGETRSLDFPVVSAVQAVNAGGVDAFVAKLNPSGNALVYSTYLGGFSSDIGYGIVLDPQGNAYVTGTAGADFPTTAGAFQPSYPGVGHNGVAFVVRIGDAVVKPPFRWPWGVVVAVFLLALAVVAIAIRRRRRSA